MTRRSFLQAIPGVPVTCLPADLPPALSLSNEEFEQMDVLLVAEILRLPQREVTINKSRAILRAAVRERGPVNQRR